MYLTAVGTMVGASLAGCLGAADESPVRPFGEKQHRNNIAMAATATDTTREITVADETIQPAEESFTLVRFWAENLVDSHRHLPTTPEATLTADGIEYDPQTEFDEWANGYRGGTVDPGVLRQGYVVFETPASALDSGATFTITPIESTFSDPVHWTTR